MASIRIRWGVYPALAALGLAAGLAAVPSHAATPPPFSRVFTVAAQSPVGVTDLDGDGHGDIMVEEERPTSEMQFRRGTDGALLWSLPLDHQLVLGVIRAGGGRPAVLTEQYPSRLLRALDAPTGNVAWSSNALAPGQSLVLGYLPGKPWQPTRILVGRPADVGYRPIVVSGRDGTSRKVGLPGAEVRAVGDEDGDGYADFVLANGNELEVRSSTTGKAVWVRVFAGSPEVFPSVLPDVTGDHRGDILAMDQSGLTTRATAVDGHTGANLWTMSQPSTDLKSLGDANHDGHTDLVTIDSGGCQAIATAYSGLSGKVLWQRSFANPPALCQQRDYAPGAELAGDVNADRVFDVLVQTDGFNGPRVEEMVDGRTGNPLWESTVPDAATNGETGLGTSFDGAGEDLTIDWLIPAVTVYDGRTNAQLFSVPMRDDVWERSQQAGQLTDDNQPDLAFATYPYDNTITWTGRPVQVGVVDGQTHSVRWAVDITQ